MILPLPPPPAIKDPHLGTVNNYFLSICTQETRKINELNFVHSQAIHAIIISLLLSWWYNRLYHTFRTLRKLQTFLGLITFFFGLVVLLGISVASTIEDGERGISSAISCSFSSHPCISCSLF